MKTLKDYEYYRTELGVLYCGDCLEILPLIPDNSVDLILTSPPYDNLREYNGFNMDFSPIANNLIKKMVDGAVLVWVVRDATIDGNETGTSFRHALSFKDKGLKLFDTMIMLTDGSNPHANRYTNQFEYMFVLTKGKIKTTNIIKDRINSYFDGRIRKSTKREKDGKTYPRIEISRQYSQRTNVWYYSTGYMKSAKDDFIFEHPAIFHQNLANDHIISWSNSYELILDCFFGSGTTGAVCEKLNRRWIGIEISEKYCEIAKKRIKQEADQMKLFK